MKLCCLLKKIVKFIILNASSCVLIKLKNKKYIFFVYLLV